MKIHRSSILIGSLFVYLLGCKKGENKAAPAPAAMDAAAAAAAKPTPDAPPPAPPVDAAVAAAKERRWVYKATMVAGDEEEKTSKHKVEMVESGRKTGAGLQAIELTVLLDGKPLDEETVADFGAAPFDVMGDKVTLIIGPYKKDRAVWLYFGAVDTLDSGDVKTALEEPPSWPLAPAVRKKKEPKEMSGDGSFYGKTIASWDSICQGLSHFSEESGDSFTWERCLDPTVGITKLDFDSVWGGSHLELVTAPSDFALPP